MTRRSQRAHTSFLHIRDVHCLRSLTVCTPRRIAAGPRRLRGLLHGLLQVHRQVLD